MVDARAMAAAVLADRDPIIVCVSLFPLAQTLAMPIYPYPYWEPQSASGLW